jgi:hypothetical protein
MAFRQSRLMNLISRKSDVEFELQVIEATRTQLANNIVGLFSIVQTANLAEDTVRQEILENIRGAFVIAGSSGDSGSHRAGDAGDSGNLIEQEFAEPLTDSELIEHQVKQELSMIDAELNEIQRSLADT